MMSIIRISLFAWLIISGLLTFAQREEDLANTAIINIDSCNVYQVILSSKEASIRSFFKKVSSDEFDSICTAQILDAFSKLTAKDKVTHTIWILEEVKIRSIDIREKVYFALLKVNYPKPAYMLKPMINSYFTSYREPDDTLAKQVNALHWNMIR